MKAGRYNRRGTLQMPATGQDGAGQPLTGFVDVAPVWASILNQTGMATIKADGKSSSVQASVRLRFREDVRPGWRFVYKTTVYNVKALAPDLARREHVDLICEVVL